MSRFYQPDWTESTDRMLSKDRLTYTNKHLGSVRQSVECIAGDLLLVETSRPSDECVALSGDGLRLCFYTVHTGEQGLIRKLRRDQCTLIMIAPCWETQSWFPILQEMLYKSPVPLRTYTSTRVCCTQPEEQPSSYYGISAQLC